MPLRPQFLLDTGPLAACFDPLDQHHAWAIKTVPQLEAPLTTCEAVLAESFYLLSKTHNGVDLLAAFCETGTLEIEFSLLDHAKPLRELMQKYRNLPMDLADACLVLLAEQHPDATLITTDRDFLLYRTRTRRQIRILAPFS